MGRYTTSYNERLFQGGGLRQYLHTARFRWARNLIGRYEMSCRRVIEIGCYDGKLIDYLPEVPDSYLGVDANWEKGLDIARSRFESDERVQFIETDNPCGIPLPETPYDLAVSMETLEHMPDVVTDRYLARIREILNGYLLITVPNEIGPVFATKWMTKRMIYGDAEPYKPLEFLNQTLGRTHKVERNQHKGFNHSRLVERVAKHFEILVVEGIPFERLPPIMSFGIGILARTR